MEFVSYGINYCRNSSSYSIRLHNTSGGECCLGQEADVQHCGGISPSSDVSGGRVHIMRKVAFQQLRKMSWGNGRQFPNLGAPCLPGVNTQWEWESLKCRLPAGFCEGWGPTEVSKGSACIPVGILGLGDRRAGFAWRMAVGGGRPVAIFCEDKKRQIGRTWIWGDWRRRAVTQAWKCQYRQWQTWAEWNWQKNSAYCKTWV